MNRSHRLPSASALVATTGLLVPGSVWAGAVNPGPAPPGMILTTLPAHGPSILLLAMGICILAGLSRLCWCKPAPARVRSQRRIRR